MKLFLVILGMLFVPETISTRCISGCPCSDDTPCEYYCSDAKCHNHLWPPDDSCEGQDVHPRECGSSAYCDTSTMTCTWIKGDGEMCSADYECSSEYCDSTTGTCQPKPSDFDYTFIWAPITAVGGLFLSMVLLAICMKRKIRRQELAWNQIERPHIVAATVHVVAFENPGLIAEPTPPSYSEATSIINKDP